PMTSYVRRGLGWEDVPLPEPTELAARYAARLALREYTHCLLAEQQLDAVLYPSAQQVATRIGVEQPGVFTRWSEHTGQPALGLPLGLVAPEDGNTPLPCSAELLGPLGADERLLTIAATIEPLLPS
ncbi:MAG: amidase, partial [Promicromonosporaceae bacterium]|nr:amidase [Promicromonosporaceae bacterium]